MFLTISLYHNLLKSEILDDVKIIGVNFDEIVTVKNIYSKRESYAKNGNYVRFNFLKNEREINNHFITVDSYEMNGLKPFGSFSSSKNNFPKIEITDNLILIKKTPSDIEKNIIKFKNPSVKSKSRTGEFVILKNENKNSPIIGFGFCGKTSFSQKNNLPNFVCGYEKKERSLIYQTLLIINNSEILHLRGHEFKYDNITKQVEHLAQWKTHIQKNAQIKYAPQNFYAQIFEMFF